MANLRGVHPVLRRLFGLMHRMDARFVVTSGVRSRAEQQDLWNRYQAGERTGLFAPAMPGTSSHERGLAMDVARFGIDATSDELLASWGAAWRAAGGVWGGEKDPVHFALPASRRT